MYHTYIACMTLRLQYIFILQYILVLLSMEVIRMWKYITKEQCNQFLLSLHLVDCESDKKVLNKIYTISNSIFNNYHVFKIKKRSNGYRTIYEPTYNLKIIQTNILKNILEHKKISKYAKAYYQGVKLIDNAKPHLNKKDILKLDIENFFENISFMKIYNNCFQLEYFPFNIGILLTKLCTYDDFLPQGAPTSSYISNLVMKNFDEIIGKYCEERDIAYTRYSDDMTFSGNFDYKDIIKKVKEELYKNGFTLNKNKIVVVSQKSRQLVTGIVVNEKLQVANNYRKQIRQEIYYLKKYGVEDH